MSSTNTAVPSTSTANKAAGRPVLKNLTRARVPRAGMVGIALATTAALSWKFFVSDRHRRDITEFYK